MGGLTVCSNWWQQSRLGRTTERRILWLRPQDDRGRRALCLVVVRRLAQFVQDQCGAAFAAGHRTVDAAAIGPFGGDIQTGLVHVVAGQTTINASGLGELCVGNAIGSQVRIALSARNAWRSRLNISRSS